MNGKNGHNQPTAEPEGSMSVVDRIRIMRREGWEQELDSGRKVRLRTLEPHMLLRDGDCPDILTPYLVKSLYMPITNSPTPNDFEVDLQDREEAIAYADMLTYIAKKSLADDTDVDDLTLSEKKFILRLALVGAELLVSFRYEKTQDVAPVEEGEPVSQVAE